MNYHKVVENDMINGKGVRVTLFVSGCSHACKGCYNKSTWSPDSGQPYTEDVENRILDLLDNPRIRGLSITGGDPLHDNNLHSILTLITRIRWKFMDTRDIWLWTGYTMDEVQAHPLRRAISNKVDVLIDGRYEEDKRDPSLAFRGSSNQKIHVLTKMSDLPYESSK